MLVYALKNKLTGMVYVGQTTRTLADRFAQHVKVAKLPNPREVRQIIRNAIRKYGAEAFDAVELQQCSTIEELDAAERHWIATYDCISPNGYNLTAGGQGSRFLKHSEESKRKMSAWQIGKKLTPEHKAKLSQLLVGNKHALGLRHTDETKALISKMFKGKKRAPFSEEHRRRMSAAAKARWAPNRAAKEARPKGNNRGENNGQAKLTEADVSAIRALLGSGTVQQKKIAEMFEVSPTAIWSIAHGKKWAATTGLSVRQP